MRRTDLAAAGKAAKTGREKICTDRSGWPNSQPAARAGQKRRGCGVLDVADWPAHKSWEGGVCCVWFVLDIWPNNMISTGSFENSANS